MESNCVIGWLQIKLSDVVVIPIIQIFLLGQSYLLLHIGLCCDDVVRFKVINVNLVIFHTSHLVKNLTVNRNVLAYGVWIIRDMLYITC